MKLSWEETHAVVYFSRKAVKLAKKDKENLFLCAWCANKKEKSASPVGHYANTRWGTRHDARNTHRGSTLGENG